MAEHPVYPELRRGKCSRRTAEPSSFWTDIRMWYVCICDRNGQLYTGITTDLGHRMRQHGAKLLCSEPHRDKHDAARREREIKGWRREKRLALIGTCR